MKSPTIQEIKQELIERSPKELVELCVRLGRFKKENKELLTYLLYEANDLPGYIQTIKNDIDEMFESINVSQLYFVKKTLRRILRVIRKNIRYTGSKTAEAEWLIYFCLRLSESGIPFEKNQVILNMYNSTIRKVHTVVASFHEDLQYDYLKQLKTLK